MQNQIGPHGGGSEFERIKFLDQQGVERWSARDYQVLMTYETWEYFAKSLDRAKITCQTKGFDVGYHFRLLPKVMPKGRWGSTTVDDYHLSRYACYLTAMECDSSKPVVADAKTYFAISTYENEQRKATELRLPANYVDALRQLADEVERSQVLEEQKRTLQGRVLELAPKADFHDAVAEAVNSYTVAQVAKMLDTGEVRFFRWLRQKKILMTGGASHNLPYQDHLDAGRFEVLAKTREDGEGEHRNYTQTVFTGKGFVWIQQEWTKPGNPGHTQQLRLEA